MLPPIAGMTEVMKICPGICNAARFSGRTFRHVGDAPVHVVRRVLYLNEKSRVHRTLEDLSKRDRDGELDR